MLQKKTVVALLFLSSHLFAAQDNVTIKFPELAVQTSEYVSFHDASIVASGEILTFNGAIQVLGNAVFGHFDVLACDGSGKVVQLVKSADQALLRSHGPKPKPITLAIGSGKGTARVEVSFHEMRIDPDGGACKPE